MRLLCVCFCEREKAINGVADDGEGHKRSLSLEYSFNYKFFNVRLFINRKATAL